MGQCTRAGFLMRVLTLARADAGFEGTSQRAVRIHVVATHDDVQPCLAASDGRRQVDFGTSEDRARRTGGPGCLMNARRPAGRPRRLFLLRGHALSLYPEPPREAGKEV